LIAEFEDEQSEVKVDCYSQILENLDASLPGSGDTNSIRSSLLNYLKPADSDHLSLATLSLITAIKSNKGLLFFFFKV